MAAARCCSPTNQLVLPCCSMDEDGSRRGVSGKLLASFGVVGGLAILAGGSLLLKDQIK